MLEKQLALGLALLAAAGALCLTGLKAIDKKMAEEKEKRG